MNALLKAGLTCAFLILTSTNKLAAQDTVLIKSLPPVTVSAVTMHVPKKVWKNFASYFTGAYNSRFYKINRDYLARFILDDHDNRALFTKSGSFVYNISYGYEKGLPEDIYKQVKASYYDYNITKAIKVTESNRVIWIINLENQQKLIMVRIEDGEDMEEVEKLDKM